MNITSFGKKNKDLLVAKYENRLKKRMLAVELMKFAQSSRLLHHAETCEHSSFILQLMEVIRDQIQEMKRFEARRRKERFEELESLFAKFESEIDRYFIMD